MTILPLSIAGFDLVPDRLLPATRTDPKTGVTGPFFLKMGRELFSHPDNLESLRDMLASGNFPPTR